MTASAEVIHAQYFAADLSTTRAWTASPGGVIASLWANPDGGVTAAVQPPQAPPALVRLGADGREQGRTAFQVKGVLDDALALPDGSVMVLTDLEVARVDGDGRVLERRALPGAEPGPVARVLGDQGVWQAWPNRLEHLSLDGKDAKVMLPLGTPPQECAKGPVRNGRCGWELEPRLLSPLRGGGCLVQEALVLEHDASGPNRTVQAALTVLEASGNVGAQALLGKVKSSLEWFNFGPSGGNLSGLPGKFSLVRRSFTGDTDLRLVEERGHEMLLVVREGASTWLKRLDRALKERWSRFVQDGSSVALSPGWTKGILLYSGQAWLEAFDEQGQPGARDTVQASGYDPSKLRNAIGQTPAGEWLLVSY
jgi:hypothetical protein